MREDKSRQREQCVQSAKEVVLDGPRRHTLPPGQPSLSEHPGTKETSYLPSPLHPTHSGGTGME